MSEPKKFKKQKDKTKKKSSPFFANLNVDSSIEYGFAETNPKSKKVKWVIGGLLLVAATIGISVPWAMSSCVIALNKPYDNPDIMYTYCDPILEKNIPVTYKEFADRVTNNKTNINVFNKWDDIFYESVLETLYNEEREAFNKFQAIYKKLHNKNPEDSFGSNLKDTFDTVKIGQKKILEDNKISFQKTGSNWLNDWLKELQTNSIYGPQQIESGATTSSIPSLEKKAIAYMTVQKIKNSALARYQGASITTTSWDYTDYDFANTNTTDETEYAKYNLNDGTEKSISKKDAVATWKSYLTKGLNVVQPKDIIIGTNDKKIAVFETKSYVPTYRNAIQNDTLVNLINNNFKIGLLSSISVADIKPGSSNSSAFSINKDVLKKLFKIQNANTQSAAANFVPYSQLSNYQGASTINTSNDPNHNDAVQNAKDSLLSKTFNADDKTMGSSKLSEALSLVYKDSSIDFFALSAFTSSSTGITSLNDNKSLFSIYSEATNSDPFKKFLTLLFTITTNNNQLNFNNETTIKNNWDNLNYASTTASNKLVDFVKLLSSSLDTNNFTFKPDVINAGDFNTSLETRIDSLEDGDLEFLGKLLNCILIGDTTKIKSNYKSDVSKLNQVGYWTLYQLGNGSSNTFMYVNTDGIKIFSKKYADFTLDDYKKMVMSDLNNTINASGSDSTNVYYDVSSLFGKLNNDNLIIKTLLAEEANVTKFKEGIKKQLKEENNTTLNENDIYNEFIAYVNLQLNKNYTSTMKGVIENISTSLDTVQNSKRTYDFATNTENEQDILVFQTKDKYGNNSLLKTKAQIDDMFVANIINIFSPKSLSNENNKKARG